MGDQAATDAAFEKADKVVKLQIVNQRLVVNSMEPRGAICEYDAGTTARPCGSPRRAST